MSVISEQLNIYLMGMFTAAIVWFIYRFVVGVMNGYPIRMSEKKINKLIDGLQSHGFTVYQIITGRHDSGMTFEQARDATLLKTQGYLVFSDNRGFEGYLVRPRLTSNEKAELRRSQFKIVVSNEPNE